MKITISVIIPTFNEADQIARAIGTSWETGADEVLVVDGNSHDATQNIALSQGAQLLTSAPGRAIQQNLGASRAKGDVLLFLHADNWLAPDAGTQIRDCLTNPHALGGAFLQRIEATGAMYRLLEWGNAARLRWRGMAFGDQALFMRRDTFEKIKGFPPVPLMEDILLMRSFRKIAQPAILPGPVFVHPRRWQENGVIRQTLRNWTLQLAHRMGVPPKQLAHHYPVAHPLPMVHHELSEQSSLNGPAP